MDKFHNRLRDLERLSRLHRRDKAAFLVVYGRRRVGKTELLRHWVEHHLSGRHLHWVAYRTTSEVLLGSFSEAIGVLTPDLAGEVRFGSWEAAFTQLFHLAAKRPLVAVIDEFPYLVESAPEIPSLLQKLWDQHKGRSKVRLILCGSHYHMMHEQFASEQRPLYGRATESLIVEEIGMPDLTLFLPRYSPEQVVETCSVVGGVPAYLELWDDRRPVMRNIEDLILSGGTFFAQEAALLIQDEISEPRTYLGILEALGAGLKTPAELARSTGIAINHMGKYLRTLVDLRFVRRVLSEDVTQRARSRISRYEIRDPYLRFHFEFLYPHGDLVEQRRIETMKNLVRSRFDGFVGRTAYEELARSKIAELGEGGELPFAPQYIGRAWTRQAELDVVAINRRENAVLAGECKWQSTKVGEDVLDRLIARTERFDRLQGLRRHYALFSKSGFTASLKRRLAGGAESVLLFQGGGITRTPE